MDFSIYLAFSGAESAAMAGFPGRSAWFGCRLSSHNNGISFLSPPNSRCDVLILTDETPPDGHDPQRVSAEMAQAARQTKCQALLFDFQRAPTRESLLLINAIIAKSPCSVVVSASHANETEAAVLLSTPALWTPLEEIIAPWKGRELWLEIGPESGCISLCNQGSTYASGESAGPFPFRDKKLHLSYNIRRHGDSLRFDLQRTEKDLAEMLDSAGKQGISAAIGLYQQFESNLISEILPCNRQEL